MASFLTPQASAGWNVTGLRDLVQSIMLSITLMQDTAGKGDVAMAPSMAISILRLSFVDSTCVPYVSIMSKWIPNYMRLFVRSMTYPLPALLLCS